MKYRVHIYPIVRVAVEVEADSPVNAAIKADAATDLYALLDGKIPGMCHAEDIDGYLVDEELGHPFIRSTSFNKHFKPD